MKDFFKKTKIRIFLPFLCLIFAISSIGFTMTNSKYVGEYTVHNLSVGLTKTYGRYPMFYDHADWRTIATNLGNNNTTGVLLDWSTATADSAGNVYNNQGNWNRKHYGQQIYATTADGQYLRLFDLMAEHPEYIETTKESNYYFMTTAARNTTGKDYVLKIKITLKKPTYVPGDPSTYLDWHAQSGWQATANNTATLRVQFYDKKLSTGGGSWGLEVSFTSELRSAAVGEWVTLEKQVVVPATGWTNADSIQVLYYYGGLTRCELYIRSVDMYRPTA